MRSRVLIWVEPSRLEQEAYACFVFLLCFVFICVCVYFSGCGYNMCVYMHYKSNQRNLLLSDVIITVLQCPNA